ncbi:MAG: STAS-like domain-containing protein [Elusimicrobiota bacterium]|jgi:hypothetical protein|nr:STAS-like domain-containing protein [Elusimicrobiota bacterium]
MAEMKTVKMFDIINTNIAVTQEDGEKVYLILMDILKSGCLITLDFSKIEILTSSFLNTAIGKILGTQYKEVFDNKTITIANISQDDKKVVDIVLNKAKEFFKKK